MCSLLERRQGLSVTRGWPCDLVAEEWQLDCGIMISKRAPKQNLALNALAVAFRVANPKKIFLFRSRFVPLVSPSVPACRSSLGSLSPSSSFSLFYAWPIPGVPTREMTRSASGTAGVMLANWVFCLVLPCSHNSIFQVVFITMQIIKKCGCRREAETRPELKVR
jgi:hypothetical protein